jgi:hypothetical protein
MTCVSAILLDFGTVANIRTESTPDSTPQDDSTYVPEAASRPKLQKDLDMISRVPEAMEKHSCAIIVDGKLFTTKNRVNLKDNTGLKEPTYKVSIKYGEPNLLGDMILEVSALRKRDAPGTPEDQKVNKHGKKSSRVSYFVNPVGLKKYDVHDPRNTEPPACIKDVFEYFDKEKEVIAVNRALLHLVVDAKYIQIVGKVEQYIDEGCQANAEAFDSYMRNAKQNTATLDMWLVVPISMEEFDLDGTRWHKHSAKLLNDVQNTPMNEWFPGAPRSKKVNKGTILPPHERPLLSTQGLTVRRTLIWHDKREQQVHLIYGEVNEHSFPKGMMEDLTKQELPCKILELPGTRFKDNEWDNDLPKSYYLDVDWSNYSDYKLKPTDKVKVRLPFQIIPCEEYTGDDAKPPRAVGQWDDEDDEDDFFDDAGDFVLPTGAGDKKVQAAASQDAAERNELEMLSTWDGIVLEQDVDTPPGHYVIFLTRPKDPRWLGPNGKERRINTIVPAEKCTALHKKAIVYQLNQTAPIMAFFKPSWSEQYFKDVIRCFDILMQKDYSKDPSLAAHLSDWFLDFDSTSRPYPILNMLTDVFPTGYEKYLEDLTDHQKEAMLSHLGRVENGYIPIVGCVASAKTRVSVIIAFLCMVQGKKVAFAQETNVGADELLATLKELMAKHGIKKKICRLGSLPQERRIFRSKELPVTHREHFKLPENDESEVTEGDAVQGDEYDVIEDFLAADYLTHLARDANETLKQGDKRFTRDAEPYALHTLMYKRFQEHHNSNAKYRELSSLLTQIRDSPNDHTLKMSQLNPLIKLVMQDTIGEQDAVIATDAQFLRSIVHQSLPTIYALVLDEGCRRSAIATQALVGAIDPTGYVSDDGDPKQLGRWSQTLENPKIWNPFDKPMSYPILERCQDCGVPGIILTEQHRSRIPLITTFLSSTFYNGVMTDGTLGKPETPEMKICTQLIQELYSIRNSNYAFVKTKGSRAEEETAGTSVYNPAHLEHFKEIMEKLDNMIAETDMVFDKDKFSVCYLTPYKAQADLVNDYIRRERLFATSSMCNTAAQGIGRQLIILDMTNTKVTTFGGNEKLTLVGLSRHISGLIILMPERCFEPKAYGLKSPDALALHPPFKIWNNLWHLSEAEGYATSIFSTKPSECRNCGESGHKKADCKQPPNCRHICGRCYQMGHLEKDCTSNVKRIDYSTKDPFTKLNKDGQSCQRCGSNMHYHWEIDGCKKCKACDHDKDHCPKTRCIRCYQRGHTKAVCESCLACGKVGHSKRDCKAPRGGLAYYRTQPTMDDPAPEPEHETHDVSANEPEPEPEGEDVAESETVLNPETQKKTRTVKRPNLLKIDKFEHKFQAELLEATNRSRADSELKKQEEAELAIAISLSLEQLKSEKSKSSSSSLDHVTIRMLPPTKREPGKNYQAMVYHPSLGGSFPLMDESTVKSVIIEFKADGVYFFNDVAVKGQRGKALVGIDDQTNQVEMLTTIWTMSLPAEAFGPKDFGYNILNVQQLEIYPEEHWQDRIVEMEYEIIEDGNDGDDETAEDENADGGDGWQQNDGWSQNNGWPQNNGWEQHSANNTAPETVDASKADVSLPANNTPPETVDASKADVSPSANNTVPETVDASKADVSPSANNTVPETVDASKADVSPSANNTVPETVDVSKADVSPSADNTVPEAVDASKADVSPSADNTVPDTVDAINADALPSNGSTALVHVSASSLAPASSRPHTPSRITDHSSEFLVWMKNRKGVGRK